MTTLRVDTTAFSEPAVPSDDPTQTDDPSEGTVARRQPRRRRAVRTASLPVDSSVVSAAAPGESGEVSSDTARTTRRPGVTAETVELEFRTGDGVFSIQAKTTRGETWRAVDPDALRHGLTVIFERESRLERTAALLGLAAEDLLDALSESASGFRDRASGLPEAERQALDDAGISLEGPPDDPSGAGQLALGISKFRAFTSTALTVAEAARAVGVSTSRVRQLAGTRDIITIFNGATGSASATPASSSGSGSRLLPAWQFVDGQLVPGLRVLSEVAADVHPLTLAGFMTRPDVDLEVDGSAVSPVEWLLSGGDPQRVADLAAGLLVAA